MNILKLLLVTIAVNITLSGDTLLSPVDEHFAKTKDMAFYCSQEDIVIAVVGDTELKVIWNNPYKKNKVEVLRCKDFNVWENLNG